MNEKLFEPVEGDEIAAPQGIMETTKKHQPILAISVYKQPENFFTIKNWMKSMFPKYELMARKPPWVGKTALLAFIK